MIAHAETATRAAAPASYQIQFLLNGADPPIWRRLQVPGNANLGWLHAVLQVAMGWTNSHLHQFTCGECVYSDPSFALDEDAEVPRVLDESKATLAAVLPGVSDGLMYEYDFGDCWQHIVVVDKVLPADPSTAKTARCLGGERACPPDDCGGLGGYEKLLKALRNRKHPEHQSMKEWLGRPFDPEHFDVGKTNTWLRKLPWPHVSESRLRKVLQGRDNYHE